MIQICRFLLVSIFIFVGVAAIYALVQGLEVTKIVINDNTKYVFVSILILYLSWIALNLSPLGDYLQDLTLNTRKPSAREKEKLDSIVNELNRRAQTNKVKRIPNVRLRMISDECPNAMAFGSRSIAMSTGLLNRDISQARAVFAHEIGHLLHMDTLYLSLKIASLAPFFFILNLICFPILRFVSEVNILLTCILIFFLSPLFITGFLGLFLLNLSDFFEQLLSRSIEYRADNYAVMLTRDNGLPDFFDFIAPFDVPPGNTFMASYMSSHPPTELRHERASKTLQEIQS